jgi:hypothetical protein
MGGQVVPPPPPPGISTGITLAGDCFFIYWKMVLPGTAQKPIVAQVNHSRTKNSTFSTIRTSKQY